RREERTRGDWRAWSSVGPLLIDTDFGVGLFLEVLGALVVVAEREERLLLRLQGARERVAVRRQPVHDLADLLLDEDRHAAPLLAQLGDVRCRTPVEQRENRLRRARGRTV